MAEAFKKAIDLSGLSKGMQERLESASGTARLDARGIAGDAILEPIPEFLKTESEHVIQGKNNSWVVLGRDRPASRVSGYGGRGDTQCASIDLVVGRMGSEPKSVDETGGKIFADPDFKKDAARIYISQKTDIDKNFELVAGEVGESKAKSGIGLKADAIRFVARDGIKLVTGVDSRNSQGAKIEEVRGVDILAGNQEETLEPMVRGDALVQCIERLVFHLDKLSGIVDNMLTAQMSFNSILTNHFHYSPFYGLATTPSVDSVKSGTKALIDHTSITKADLVKFKANLIMFKNNFLQPSGTNYINSRFNQVN